MYKVQETQSEKGSYFCEGKFILGEGGRIIEERNLFAWAEWVAQHGSYQERILKRDVDKETGIEIVTLFTCAGKTKIDGERVKPFLWVTQANDKDHPYPYPDYYSCTKDAAKKLHKEVFSHLEKHGWPPLTPDCCIKGMGFCEEPPDDGFEG